MKLNNLTMCFATAAVLSGCNMHNGDGNYVGTVSRIQTDGIFDMCKTWEGEIAAINIRGRGQGSSSTMHFTVRDKDIAAQIEDAMIKQTPVRIEFSDTRNPWPCRQGSRDIVTKVIPMENALNSPFGGKGGAAVASGEEDSPVTSGNRVFVCRETDASRATGTGAMLAPTPSANPEASGTMIITNSSPPKSLPKVLEIK